VYGYPSFSQTCSTRAWIQMERFYHIFFNISIISILLASTPFGLWPRTTRLIRYNIESLRNERLEQSMRTLRFPKRICQAYLNQYNLICRKKVNHFMLRTIMFYIRYFTSSLAYIYSQMILNPIRERDRGYNVNKLHCISSMSATIKETTEKLHRTTMDEIAGYTNLKKVHIIYAYYVTAYLEMYVLYSICLYYLIFMYIIQLYIYVNYNVNCVHYIWNNSKSGGLKLWVNGHCSRAVSRFSHISLVCRLVGEKTKIIRLKYKTKNVFLVYVKKKKLNELWCIFVVLYV